MSVITVYYWRHEAAADQQTQQPAPGRSAHHDRRALEGLEVFWGWAQSRLHVQSLEAAGRYFEPPQSVFTPVFSPCLASQCTTGLRTRCFAGWKSLSSCRSTRRTLRSSKSTATRFPGESGLMMKLQSEVFVSSQTAALKGQTGLTARCWHFVCRIAANEPSFLSAHLRIQDQRDKQKLNIKALDVVLFGPPTRKIKSKGTPFRSPSPVLMAINVKEKCVIFRRFWEEF